jgi:hypothetical protein
MRIERHMSEFARRVRFAAKHLTADDDADADAV